MRANFIRRAYAYPLIIIISTLTNCGTTHVIQQDEERVIEKIVTIKTKHEKHRVYNVMAENDSLVARDVKTSSEIKIHMRDIRSISKTNRVKGALLGAVVAGVGITTISSMGVGSESEILWVPLTMISVPVAGFMIGTREHFIFKQTGVNPLLHDGLTSDVSQQVPSIPDSLNDTLEVQNKESLVQLSELQISKSLENIFRDLKHNLTIEGYWGPTVGNTEWAYSFHYRRYTSLALFQGPTPKADNRYYFGLSWRDAGGPMKENDSDVYWNGGGFNFNYGVESYRIGNYEKGATLFYELGIMAGFKSSTDHEIDESERNKGGFGLLGIAGARAWSNSFLAELKIGFDTVTFEVMPTIGVGYRF